MMRQLLSLLLLLSLLAPLLRPLPARAADDPAERLWAAMSPAERVGQLFVVSYVGSDVGTSSDVAQLIRDERVGGVVLLAANQNFVNDPQAPFQVRAAAETMQAAALEGGTLPLLIAIDHEGDGWPYSRLTGGTTPLPSPMAVGATWDVQLAHAVGQLTGQELAAAGINLILGPSVDVLAEPSETNKGDLGTRVFGGDPYWVGQMGRAYITGIHEGGAGRVATVAKHFPGHGGSDRLPDNEVATVDKSLQELRRIELPPFFAITRFEQPDDPAVTDALMSSHIRYRGFQGNIRQFTAPISFDPQGLQTILAEKEFDAWRERGLIVSDSLGVPAVKRYFDPTGQNFPHRQVARDALMAGNELLILAQFALDDSWPAQLANMRDTLAYFREQYASDRAFAERVDAAARQVIRLKLKLYPEMAEGAAPMPPLPEPLFGQGGNVTQSVAEQSLTLLYPRTLEELDERLPRAPLRGEPIVIFTDARRVRDCFDCPYYQLLATDALEQAILRRYGPEGTGQINEAQLISFSFEDLELFLGVPDAIAAYESPEAAQERAQAVRDLVERAEWVLIAVQDINLSPAPGSQSPRYPESDAARLLLDAAAGSLLNKRVVAFFFNVPYQLDTTEISKLTAAFALYAKQPAFVDVAVQALFRDLPPVGAAPVTVEAVGYDLPTQLEPAPDQPLPLERRGARPLVAPTTVELRVGPILDRNGHLVPDGTTVEFVGEWRGDSEANAPRASASTSGGMAHATLRVEESGLLEVRALALQAASERPLLLAVSGPTPTPSPTSVLPPTPEPRPATALAVAPDSSARPPAESAPPSAARLPQPPAAPPRGGPLVASLVAALLVGAGVAWRGRAQGRAAWLRQALWAIVGGLAAHLLWAGSGRAGGIALAASGAAAGALLLCAVVRAARAGRRQPRPSGA